MIRRRIPNFLTKKMIGFYISFAGLLLFTHIQTYESLLLDVNMSILGSTWDHFLSYIQGHETDSRTGGGLLEALLFIFSHFLFYVQGHGTGSQTGVGLIGVLLFTFSRFLFSTIGSKIISVLTILIGIIFMTEFSIGDFTSNLFKRCKNLFVKGKGKYIGYREE